MTTKNILPRLGPAKSTWKRSQGPPGHDHEAGETEAGTSRLLTRIKVFIKFAYKVLATKSILMLTASF